jgi:hypothetical protein
VQVQGVLGIRLDHKQAPRDMLGLALEDCNFENRSLPGLITNTGFVVEIGMDLEARRGKIEDSALDRDIVLVG